MERNPKEVNVITLTLVIENELEYKKVFINPTESIRDIINIEVADYGLSIKTDEELASSKDKDTGVQERVGLEENKNITIYPQESTNKGTYVLAVWIHKVSVSTFRFDLTPKSITTITIT